MCLLFMLILETQVTEGSGANLSEGFEPVSSNAASDLACRVGDKLE